MKVPEVQLKIENKISDDAIWRQTIEKEVFGSIKDDYGFLRGGYKKNPLMSADYKNPVNTLLPELSGKGDAFKSGLPSILPCGLAEEGTFESDLKYTGNIRKIMEQKYPFEKYTFPCSSAMRYGWPFSSSKAGDFNVLEKFGHEARGKRDIHKYFLGVYETRARMHAADKE